MLLRLKNEPIKLVSMALLIASFAVLFGDTVLDLVKDWSINDNYSHGFLIPFITAFMIWRKRDELSEIAFCKNRFGLVIILLGMLAFSIGSIGSELFTKRMAIIITIFGLCTYILGRRYTTAIGIPLLYMVFMVPVPGILWNQVAFPLQLFTSKLAFNTVQVLGIPIYREGNILHLSNTTLEVVEACSGLRSLVSLLALSGAFAYISNLEFTKKWVLFLSAVPIAIIVNIIRLTLAAIMAAYIGPSAAQGLMHDISGVLVFIGALAMMYAVYVILCSFGKHSKPRVPDK